MNADTTFSTCEKDARELAIALRRGPVRFIWTDGFSAYGIYMVPAPSIVPLSERHCGG